jgi:hypothetical protein
MPLAYLPGHNDTAVALALFRKAGLQLLAPKLPLVLHCHHVPAQPCYQLAVIVLLSGPLFALAPQRSHFLLQLAGPSLHTLAVLLSLPKLLLQLSLSLLSSQAVGRPTFGT